MIDSQENCAVRTPKIFLPIDFTVTGDVPHNCKAAPDLIAALALAGTIIADKGRNS